MIDPKERRRGQFEPGEVDAAYELYMHHGPNQPARIVIAMRERGWNKFVVSDIKGRPHVGFPGLETFHGWLNQWRELHPPPEKPSKHETPPTIPTTEPSAATPVELTPAPTPASASDLPTWLEAARPGWKWRWRFQMHVYRELEKLTDGRSNRLMVFMPPRHGKSELVTIGYAAWRLRRDPATRIIIGSYNQRLANRFSRRIKGLYLGAAVTDQNDAGEETQLVLRAMDEWETASGGGVKAVGVGAGVTGFGADLIIVDDPIKSRADAESKNNRERIWEWFTDDLMTRLEPNGSVILIQTRWHEDDLAGRLLQPSRESGVGSLEQEKKKVRRSRLKTKDSRLPWSVVRLPALAEERDPLGRRQGAALCHERFPRRELLRKKAEMGSYSFAALYQQQPMPAEGALFKRQWFTRIVTAAPPHLRWFRGYDLAVSTKTSADYTASFRCALDKTTGDLYIADGFRARIEFPDQRKYIVERFRSEPGTEHGIELALHGQAFMQELWRETGLSKYAFRGIRVTNDKFTRALAWANRAEAGKVVLVNGPWISDFIDEAAHFPNAAHDDQIDAVSLAVQMIETPRNRCWAF